LTWRLAANSSNSSNSIIMMEPLPRVGQQM